MIPVIDGVAGRVFNPPMRRWFALLLMCCLPLQAWAGAALCAGMAGDAGRAAVAAQATCHHEAATPADEDAAPGQLHDCRHCLHCAVATVPPLPPSVAAVPASMRIVIAELPHAGLSHAPGPRPPSTV